MLHRTGGWDDYELKLQQAQLRYVVTSAAATTTLAENYVGMKASV